MASDPAGDVSFHELLVSLAGCPRLTQMHETLITETRLCIHALSDFYRSGEAVGSTSDSPSPSPWLTGIRS
ncbi:hypothetical protein [Ornithinicoccus hortensis]|uniref:hypothetical protein n=1 Tax=Ornithinicoccus hortensis TaxID=82346 RepID=UPI001152348D|nr:hypothetical protein [Ornithinicoccus hortensis]